MEGVRRCNICVLKYHFWFARNQGVCEIIDEILCAIITPSTCVHRIFGNGFTVWLSLVLSVNDKSVLRVKRKAAVFAETRITWLHLITSDLIFVAPANILQTLVKLHLAM
jgi:hypothetical protein